MRGTGSALFAVVLVVAVGSGTLHAADEERLEEWRATIEYGIDSELTDVMEQMQESGTTALNEAILDRYRTTLADSVRREILTYFTETEYDGAEEAARTVVENFRDHSSELVLQAMRYLTDALGEPSEASRQAVRKLVDSSGGRISTAAVRALGKIGGETDGDYLLELIQARSTSQDVRNEAILALGELEHAPAEGLLIDLATDDDRSITTRRYAVDSLGKITAETALPTLRTLAGSQNSILRAQTAAALGSYGSEQVSALLLSLLRDSNAAVRTQALKALAKQPPADTTAIRYKAENDPEPSVQVEAMKTLVSIGEEAAVGEIAVAEEHSAMGRMRAVDALVSAESADATRALREVIEEEWDQSTPAMTIRLARTMSQRSEFSNATESLVEQLLSHPNQTVQLYAIQAVMRAEAIAAYQRKLSELAESAPAPAVRSAASQALPEQPEEDGDAEEQPGDADQSGSATGASPSGSDAGAGAGAAE